MEERSMTLAATDFQLLANAGFPPAKFEPGDIIFSAGDKGDKMYVIRSGDVEVERDGKIVETLSGGGIFGEMALIDGSPRAATARAKTACEVAPITEKTFLFLVHETPFFAIAVSARWPIACDDPPHKLAVVALLWACWLAIVSCASHDRARLNPKPAH
jgi:CRP/FNR family cyclic AMP-dependent transcriptional regulator